MKNLFKPFRKAEFRDQNLHKKIHIDWKMWNLQISSHRFSTIIKRKTKQLNFLCCTFSDFLFYCLQLRASVSSDEPLWLFVLFSEPQNSFVFPESSWTEYYDVSAVEEFPGTALIFPPSLWLVGEGMMPSSPPPSFTLQTDSAEESDFFSLHHPLLQSLQPLLSSSSCSSSLPPLPGLPLPSPYSSSDESQLWL